MRLVWLLVLLAFAAGAILGWSIGNMKAGRIISPQVGIGGGPGENASPLFSKPANFHVALNNLLIEHGELTALHLQAIYDGKDISATSRLLYANSTQIADLIGIVYGDQAGNDFFQIWQAHIKEYVNYTKALKSKDRNETDEAKQNLKDSAEDMGKILNSIDRNIPAGDITNIMKDHITLTLSIINAYANHNQPWVVSQTKEASDQVSRFAYFLTQKIIASKPDVFK